jgi:hypothetical protein
VNRPQRHFLFLFGFVASGFLAGESLLSAAGPLILGFGAVAIACLFALVWDYVRPRGT